MKPEIVSILALTLTGGLTSVVITIGNDLRRLHRALVETRNDLHDLRRELEHAQVAADSSGAFRLHSQVSCQGGLGDGFKTLVPFRELSDGTFDIGHQKGGKVKSRQTYQVQAIADGQHTATPVNS